MPPDRVIFTGPFDPRLSDGISSSIFDLLGFLHRHGHEVEIVSLMHEGFALMTNLDAVSSRRQVKILSQEKNCIHFVMDGITVSHEELPFSRGDMLRCHPEVLARYVQRIRTYPGSHFLTVDDDCTGLVAHSVAGSRVDHFVYSPVDTIEILQHVPNYVQILKGRNVFTVSTHARETLSKECGIASRVWPPVIELSWVTDSHEGSRERAIGYYSAGPHKGDAIVNQLTDLMPDQRFLVMGEQSELRLQKPNVAFPGYIRDLDQFYGSLSLLLVPSLIPEGYPRVILEAAACGVPVIANRIGGIPEALGDSGILVDMEPSAHAMAETYCRTIREVLEDPRRYGELQERALQRAADYRKEIERTGTDYIARFFCG